MGFLCNLANVVGHSTEMSEIWSRERLKEKLLRNLGLQEVICKHVQNARRHVQNIMAERKDYITSAMLVMAVKTITSLTNYLLDDSTSNLNEHG